MSTPTTTPSGYDYSRLPPESREVAQIAASNIRRIKAGAVIEVGRQLVTAKEALPHGEFGLWLQQEFDWTDRTARNCMSVYERFGKSEIIAGPDADNIAATAFMLLAAPSVPEAARDEAVSMAKEGRKVSTKAAKAIVARHAPSKPSKPSKTPEPPGIGQELARLNASLSLARVVAGRDDADRQLVVTHASDLLRKLQVLAGEPGQVVEVEVKNDTVSYLPDVPPAGPERWLQDAGPAEVAETIVRTLGPDTAFVVVDAILALLPKAKPNGDGSGKRPLRSGPAPGPVGDTADAKLLRGIREQRGMSLRAFAGSLGIAHTTLGLVESGKQPMSAGLRERLAEHGFLLQEIAQA
jgi:hypothetical protein